jgi:hypothetical protein
MGSGGEILVFLGKEGDRKWFLVVMGGREDALQEDRAREELLFLAGECAGLLLYHGFAGEVG